MPRLPFDPATHGFPFVNRFTNTVGPFTTSGLCGGMALAAFSYFRNGVPVPQHDGTDFGTPDGVPPEGRSRLRSYIFDQQMISFRTAAPFFLPSWPWETDEQVLRNQLNGSIADFERLKQIVNAGRFPQLGFRSSTRGNLLGHQVLAYGYEENPRRIIHYDPNWPNEECHLILDPALGRVVQRFADGRETPSSLAYGSYFIAFDLDPSQPGLLNEFGRPPYIDLAVMGGVGFSAPFGDGLRQVGEPLTVSATVRNLGEAPSRFGELLLWARSPGGVNRDADLGVRAPITRLDPGQEFRFERQFPAFGEQPGPYLFGVSILSLRNRWIILPIAAGGMGVGKVDLVAGVDRQVGTGGFRGDGLYRIRARHSGKVLDVDTSWFRGQNNGQSVLQWDWHGGTNQRFRVEGRGNNEWSLRPQHATQKAIDVDNARGNGFAGARVQQWDFHGGPNQRFRIEPVADHYRIVAVHSGQVLDVSGASGAAGAALVQWPWHGGNNQLFQFEAL